MDFTNPFQYQRTQGKLSLEELLSELRVDLAAELDAINLYQAHYDATDDELAREVLAHVRDEEKEHVAEFMALINRLDAVQKAKFAEEEVREIEQGDVAAIAAEGKEESASPASGPNPGTFTVGDLFGQKQCCI